MNTLFTILIVLIIIASILLILAVLAQNSKGGMASNFGAGNQTFGVRQTVDILEKITWGLISFIIVAAIIASLTFKSASKNADSTIVNSDDIKVENTEQPVEFPNPTQETTTNPEK